MRQSLRDRREWDAYTAFADDGTAMSVAAEVAFQALPALHQSGRTLHIPHDYAGEHSAQVGPQGAPRPTRWSWTVAPILQQPGGIGLAWQNHCGSEYPTDLLAEWTLCG